MSGRSRTFDWGEAVRVYEHEGLSARAIGRRLGVSGVSVARALRLSGVHVEQDRRPHPAVRADALRCVVCKEWKADREFPRNQREAHRRGRHTVCRDDQAAMRQKAREGRMMTCAACGGPRLHDNDGVRGFTGLCLSCYRARRSAIPVPSDRSR